MYLNSSLFDLAPFFVANWFLFCARTPITTFATKKAKSSASLGGQTSDISVTTQFVTPGASTGTVPSPTSVSARWDGSEQIAQSASVYPGVYMDLAHNLLSAIVKKAGRECYVTNVSLERTVRMSVRCGLSQATISSLIFFFYFSDLQLDLYPRRV